MKSIKLEDAKEVVRMRVEELHTNPFELLGRWNFRKKQDALFDKTMIEALELYIEEKGLNWDETV